MLPTKSSTCQYQHSGRLAISRLPAPLNLSVRATSSARLQTRSDRPGPHSRQRSSRQGADREAQGRPPNIRAVGNLGESWMSSDMDSLVPGVRTVNARSSSSILLANDLTRRRLWRTVGTAKCWLGIILPMQCQRGSLHRTRYVRWRRHHGACGTKARPRCHPDRTERRLHPARRTTPSRISAPGDQACRRLGHSDIGRLWSRVLRLCLALNRCAAYALSTRPRVSRVIAGRRMLPLARGSRNALRLAISCGIMLPWRRWSFRVGRMCKMTEPKRTVTVEPVNPSNPSRGPFPRTFENNVCPWSPRWSSCRARRIQDQGCKGDARIWQYVSD